MPSTTDMQPPVIARAGGARGDLCHPTPLPRWGRKTGVSRPWEATVAVMTPGPYWRRSDVVVAMGAGVLYGVVAQLVVRLELLSELYGVMSFGYVFLLPAVLGVITALNLAPERKLASTLVACCGTSAL